VVFNSKLYRVFLTSELDYQGHLKYLKLRQKKAVRFSELGVCRNEDALKHKVVALGSLLTATLGRKSPWKRLTLLVVLLHVHLSCRCCSTTLWRATLATKSSPCCRSDVTGVATTTFWRTSRFNVEQTKQQTIVQNESCFER